MPPIEIRRLRPVDEHLLDNVADDVFDEPVDDARLKACLASPGHLLFVALDDGQVVAQAAGMIHRHLDKPTELYVDELGVSPAWQRRGIANRLMDALFAAGREAGCEEAWLGTELDNIPARALYERRKEPVEPAETFVMYVYDLRDDA
ncbi:aminoglycoside 6'-N-acetyltransferase I [Aminobacter lissarensis]|uniref:Aminoglycoside 6'-N-acetyltransferase I n=1 Tax=Aminobacter carboxidus TaxID=376165 RepID=A0A8E1WCK1_9HYPH|nr:GNAT family N-acetyltransferase [Aminobacter lissarensis]MBB6465768.1 aminoglycoside 6'-N-acetyltransferase I [Aminobacter lissarensis]